MSGGLLIILTLMVVLGAITLWRGDAGFERGLLRGVEQIVKLLPRMFCALIGASFAVQLVPTSLIAAFLGADAGVLAIALGAAMGTLIPAGPVVAFSIAAVFANEGASVPALVTFVTSWSVHALHRVFIFEIPLLGTSFLRLRFVSVLLLPFLAGAFSLAVAEALMLLETVYTLH